MDENARPAGWLDHLGRDVRHAWRVIGRMPWVASVVIVSLGIGIGFNVAVFSWIQAVAFRPLPGVRDAARFQIVQLETGDGHSAGASWPEYLDLRQRIRGFGALFAYRMVPVTVGDAATAERGYGMLVSDNYFPALGLGPAAGRFFRPDEVTRPGAEPVTVISWDVWQKRFDGAESAIGRQV